MFWRYPLGRAKTSISSFVQRRRRLRHDRGRRGSPARQRGAVPHRRRAPPHNSG